MRCLSYWMRHLQHIRHNSYLQHLYCQLLPSSQCLQCLLIRNHIPWRNSDLLLFLRYWLRYVQHCRQRDSLLPNLHSQLLPQLQHLHCLRCWLNLNWRNTYRLHQLHQWVRDLQHFWNHCHLSDLQRQFRICERGLHCLRCWNYFAWRNRSMLGLRKRMRYLHNSWIHCNL